jgi:hypothetical protein
MKSGGFHFQRSRAGIRSAPTLSTIHWLNTVATLMASKSGIESGIENSTLLKYLQIKGVIGVDFGFQP